MAKVFIIDNYSHGIKYDRRWEYFQEDVRRWGYEVKMIEGIRDKRINLYPILNNAVVSENLGHLLFRNEIQDGDIVLFPNARDQLASYLHEYRLETNLKIHLIGFWHDGVYNINGELRNKILGGSRISKLKWNTALESMLINSYDYNLISSTSNYNRFFSTYGIKNRENIFQVKTPFSRTTEMIESFIKDEGHVKDELIVMNSRKNSPQDEQIFKYIQSDFPQYTFLKFDDWEFTETEYYRLLSKAKILILTNRADANPYNVYEAMVLGCIPIIPDIPIYENVFNDRWKYDELLITPPGLNFLRNKENLYEKIRSSDEYLLYLKDDVEELERNHYNSSDFETLFNNIKIENESSN